MIEGRKLKNFLSRIHFNDYNTRVLDLPSDINGRESRTKRLSLRNIIFKASEA